MFYLQQVSIDPKGTVHFVEILIAWGLVQYFSLQLLIQGWSQSRWVFSRKLLYQNMSFSLITDMNGCLKLRA